MAKLLVSAFLAAFISCSCVFADATQPVKSGKSNLDNPWHPY